MSSPQIQGVLTTDSQIFSQFTQASSMATSPAGTIAVRGRTGLPGRNGKSALVDLARPLGEGEREHGAADGERA